MKQNIAESLDETAKKVKDDVASCKQLEDAEAVARKAEEDRKVREEAARKAEEDRKVREEAEETARKAEEDRKAREEAEEADRKAAERLTSLEADKAKAADIKGKG